MLRDRRLTAVTVIAVAVALLILAVGYGLSSGEAIASAAYVASFEADSVMQVALTVDETQWQNLLENAMDEEFIAAEVSIDGVSYGMVGLRAKGNSSLSQVASSDSDRYSFKLDFSKYVEGNSFEGLNDLALNNMISDPSYLKEYLSYQLFERMGVETPLCRFAWITVNGEDWGLYLAVEQIKEDFLERNYGLDYGNLYKPDSMEMGDGVGGGERPQMDKEMASPQEELDTQRQLGERGVDQNGMQRPETDTQENEDVMQLPETAAQGETGALQRPGPEGEEPPSQMKGAGEVQTSNISDNEINSQQEQEEGQEITGDQPPSESGFPQMPDEMPQPGEIPEGFGGGGFGGRSGSGGTNLVYTDDELDSYSGIFDNTETEGTTTADQERLVAILKQLSEGEDLENCVNVEEVLRYFVVNTFLVNLDSYASGMKHNYYLYEEDGVISILPWDFNLSFGTYQAGDASQIINFPIDTPVTDSMENSPLIAKLLEVPEYLERYHELYEILLSQTVDNNWYEAEIEKLDQMISPYVEKDPTAFYSVEEYETAIEQLKLYFVDRAESIRAQLSGEQPSDDYGDMETSVDISTLGSMGGGMGGGEGHTRGGGERPAEMPGEDVQNAVAAMGRPDFAREGFSRGNGQSGPSVELLLTGGCVLLFAAGLIGVCVFRRRKYRSK